MNDRLLLRFLAVITAATSSSGRGTCIDGETLLSVVPLEKLLGLEVFGA